MDLNLQYNFNLCQSKLLPVVCCAELSTASFFQEQGVVLTCPFRHVSSKQIVVVLWEEEFTLSEVYQT